MRILGNCPVCDVADGIAGKPSEANLVECANCQTAWDWHTLVMSARADGRKLIPVEVFRFRSTVELELPPKREIAHADLIVTVLNAALMAMYPRLRVAIMTEGGLEGMVGNHYLELRNYDERIGLMVDCDFAGSPECRYVLRFYERLLRQLFEEPLLWKGREVARRGALLWIQPGENTTEGLITAICLLALRRIGGPGLAARVRQKLRDISQNPFQRHIRGLSDQEVVDIFVPPPGFEHLFGSRES